MTNIANGNFTDKSSCGTSAILNFSKRKENELLTSAETQTHVLRIINKEKGYEASVEALVTHNLRLVVSIAKQYQGLGLNLEDLIQEGSCGLYKAAQSVQDYKNEFTRDYQKRFATHAVYWIKYYILRSISKYGGYAAIPHNYFNLCYAFNDLEERLMSERDYKPSFDEVALELHQTQDFDDQKLLAALQIFEDFERMDAPLGQVADDGCITFGDTLGDNSSVIEIEKEMLRNQVEAMLQQMLTPEEYSVLYDYSGYNPDIWSEEMICEKYNISSSTITRIVSRARANILKSPQSEELHQLLRTIASL